MKELDGEKLQPAEKDAPRVRVGDQSCRDVAPGLSRPLPSIVPPSAETLRPRGGCGGQNGRSRSWRELGSQTSAAPHTATSHNEELVLQETNGGDRAVITQVSSNEGLKQQIMVSHRSGGCKAKMKPPAGSGGLAGPASWFADGVCSLCLLLVRGARALSGVSFVRTLIPSVRPRLRPDHLPKAAPAGHTRGAGCRDVHFGEGDTNAQLVAVLRAKVWDRGDRHSQAVPTAQEAGQVQAGGRHV